MNFSNTNVYVCNSCGATIMVNSSNELSKCSYCNNQLSLIEKKLENFNITKIIPFNRTEKDILKRIKSYNCFHGEKAKEIKKIYIPFYSINFSYDSFIRAQTVYQDEYSEIFTKYQIDISDNISNKLVTSTKYLDSQFLELYDINLDGMQDFEPNLLENVSAVIFETFDYEKSAKKVANFKFMRLIKEYKKNFYKIDEENIIISNLESEETGIFVPIYEILTVNDNRFFMVGVKTNAKTDRALKCDFFFHIIKCMILFFLTVIISELLSIFDLINSIKEDFRIYAIFGYCALLVCICLIVFFNKKKSDKFAKIKFTKQR